jgi:hypothetical protein
MPSSYRLVNGTLEIDGVRMHQTASKTPVQDARDKASALGIRRGEKILDICTGLGYSSIEAARRGAKVTTIEADEKVLEMAKANPASKELFGNPGIAIIVADAFAKIRDFPDSSFDAVSHDPPRLSMAGELYSLAFYRQLFRVLRRGGILFHYTGNPGRESGKNIPKGVKQRLVEAGFVRISWRDGLQGFLCTKR